MKEQKIKEETWENEKRELKIQGCLLVCVIGFVFLSIGWSTFVDYIMNEDFELISLDLESHTVDNQQVKSGYSNFLRIGFKSLDRAELDFDRFKTDELKESSYGIQLKILFKNGQLIKSQFELRGLQDKNDLIIRGSDLHKRWHSAEEREALINLSRETVKAVYIRIYQDGGSAMFKLENLQEDAKRFTSFGIISPEEANNYQYNPNQ